MLRVIKTTASTITQTTKTAATEVNINGRKRRDCVGCTDDELIPSTKTGTGHSSVVSYPAYATPGRTLVKSREATTIELDTSTTPKLRSSVSTEFSSSTASTFTNSSFTSTLPHPDIVIESTMSRKHSSPIPSDFSEMRPTRESVLRRLSEAVLRRSLEKIDLSQRGLQPSDAKLVKMALLQNANLTVLKLGYNNLCDEGVATLAGGIASHRALNLLDLGFNNIGDEGIKSLAKGLRDAASNRQGGTLQTLYLAGNLIGEDGAMAISDFIRNGSRLRRLYMTGNRIGGDGVKAITDAILEDEMRRLGMREKVASNSQITYDAPHADVQTPLQRTLGMSFGPHSFDWSDNTEAAAGSMNALALSTRTNPMARDDLFHGVQELYLGGTGMDNVGCLALSRQLEKSCSLRVLSLPNCEIGDEELGMLAASLKSNKDHLPIESIQLSFNRITHKGLEVLMNALWGSSTLKELEVDNNQIGDRGAHHIAAFIPRMKSLENLDVGFNAIKAAGLSVLMKTVAESQYLRSMSISGNAIDVNCAKAVAFALAYNCSLKSIHLVHCSIGHEGQRHISAGIVSNRRTSLKKLAGFEIGPIVVTLGFPGALKYWTNEQILNFVELMWDNKSDKNEGSVLSPNLELEIDPLSFLPGQNDSNGSSQRFSGPPDASLVVEVAKKAFQTLVANGVDLFSRRSGNIDDPSFGSPLANGAIMVETSTSVGASSSLCTNGQPSLPNSEGNRMLPEQPKSFVAQPEPDKPSMHEMPDPTRKRKIVEWLCSNFQHLNELSQVPFDSRDLWKLHQHYFTPVVNECGGTSWNEKVDNLAVSSFPDVYRSHQVGSAVTPSSDSVDEELSVPMSDPVFPGQVNSIPMLKRKVSYRFLGDANLCPELSLNTRSNSASVAKIIEQGHTGHSLPPKTKRARRNRTRISFLPRIKAKLDSYLDVCHEKALIMMRQLYFVEQALLAGQVNPIPSDTLNRTHLSGILASEAEMIVVDMI